MGHILKLQDFLLQLNNEYTKIKGKASVWVLPFIKNSVCPNNSNLFYILYDNKFKGELLRLIITVSIVKSTKSKVMTVLGKVVNVIRSM